MSTSRDVKAYSTVVMLLLFFHFFAALQGDPLLSVFNSVSVSVCLSAETEKILLLFRPLRFLRWWWTIRVFTKLWSYIFDLASKSPKFAPKSCGTRHGDTPHIVNFWLRAPCIQRRFSVMPNRPHTADATQLPSCIASAVWTQFATSSRRLPTDSVDNLETGQTDSIAVWLREFLSILITFLNNDDIMRSLLKKLSISIKTGVIKRYEVCLVSFLIVDRIRRQSSWASCCELCSHRRRRRDATRQLHASHRIWH